MEQGQEKVALVTGASSGIGKSIALRLAREHVKVIVNYNKSREGAEAVVDEIRKQNGHAIAMSCDVGNPDRVRDLFAEIKQQVGGVDILVNNAGITRDTAVLRMALEAWHEVVNTNLNGAFYCIKAAVFDMMKKRSGRIINISSLSSFYGAPGQANYAASKAGIVGLTRCLASELGPYSITVNAVIPGLVPTAMTEKIPEQRQQKLMEGIPLKRLATTDDIAATVAFLASESASYITGHVVVVDGGLSCSLSA